MSQHYRDVIRHRLQEAIDNVAEELVSRSGDSLDLMRFNQGRARGLREAAEINEAIYKELGGV